MQCGFRGNDLFLEKRITDDRFTSTRNSCFYNTAPDEIINPCEMTNYNLGLSFTMSSIYTLITIFTSMESYNTAIISAMKI